MLQQIRTSLQDAGIAIYEIFAWPGEHLFTEVTVIWPQFAANLAARGSDLLFIFLSSLAYWFLVIVASKLILSFIRDLLRVINSMLHTLVYFVSGTIANLKTTFICRVRERIHWRKSRHDEQATTVQFEDLEIAILKVAHAKGPGFALAAPDIAEKLRLRPGQAQNILDKLHQYKMMEPVIGSTDGFDNYRLSPSGSAFVSILQRQSAAQRLIPQKQTA